MKELVLDNLRNSPQSTTPQHDFPTGTAIRINTFVWMLASPIRLLHVLPNLTIHEDTGVIMVAFLLLVRICHVLVRICRVLVRIRHVIGSGSLP